MGPGDGSVEIRFLVRQRAMYLYIGIARASLMEDGRKAFFRGSSLYRKGVWCAGTNGALWANGETIVPSFGPNKGSPVANGTVVRLVFDVRRGVARFYNAQRLAGILKGIHDQVPRSRQLYRFVVGCSGERGELLILDRADDRHGEKTPESVQPALVSALGRPKYSWEA